MNESFHQKQMLKFFLDKIGIFLQFKRWNVSMFEWTMLLMMMVIKMNFSVFFQIDENVNFNMNKQTNKQMKKKIIKQQSFFAKSSSFGCLEFNLQFKFSTKKTRNSTTKKLSMNEKKTIQINWWWFEELNVVCRIFLNFFFRLKTRNEIFKSMDKMKWIDIFGSVVWLLSWNELNAMVIQFVSGCCCFHKSKQKKHQCFADCHEFFFCCTAEFFFVCFTKNKKQQNSNLFDSFCVLKVTCGWVQKKKKNFVTKISFVGNNYHHNVELNWMNEFQRSFVILRLLFRFIRVIWLWFSA